MISDVALTIFIIAGIGAIPPFIVSPRKGNVRIIHRLYFTLATGLDYLAACVGGNPLYGS